MLSTKPRQRQNLVMRGDPGTQTSSRGAGISGAQGSKAQGSGLFKPRCAAPAPRTRTHNLAQTALSQAHNLAVRVGLVWCAFCHFRFLYKCSLLRGVVPQKGHILILVPCGRRAMSVNKSKQTIVCYDLFVTFDCACVYFRYFFMGFERVVVGK
jgi:hypothetical protein